MTRPRLDRRTAVVCGLVLAVSITVPTAHAQLARRTPASADGLIVGQVVDALSGRPVGGAVVTIGGTMAVNRGPSALRVTGTALQPGLLTGADGFFVFRDLPRGEFSLTASKPGYAEGAYGRRRPGGPSQQLSLTDVEPRREVTLRIWKHGAITGTVTDELGEPLIGISIQSFKRIEANGVRRFAAATRANADDRGVYRLSNLPPGEYIVAASSRQVAAPLSLARESRDGRVSLLSDGGAIEVPRPGSTRALQLGESVYGLPDDGATPPPPESDRLSIYPPTFHPAGASLLETITVAIRSGEEREGIDLQLRPVRTVRVSGALNGPADMLAMRRLRLVPQDTDVLDASEPVTTTDGRGAFVFPAVAPGQYSLRTTTRGLNWRGEPERTLHWADVPITVAAEDVDGVHVTLRPGLIVSGTLAFDGRSPKPTAASLQQTRIVVERATSSLPESEAEITASVDDTGQFSTMGIPAGSYFVRVTDSPIGWMFKGAMYTGRDLSEHAVEVRDDLTGIAIEFTDRWTGLRGIVTSPTGQIDAAALVLLFPTDSSRWRAYTPAARRMRSARVRANGEFSFVSVPVGEYYLTAIADEDGADWQDPQVLDVLSRSAMRLMMNDGDQKTITIRRRDGRQ